MEIFIMKEFMLEVTQRGHVFISADSWEEAEKLWEECQVSGQFDIEWADEKPTLTGQGEEI
tara:strand:+ start:417 stop:599 length:183 start_codon:yes stop_codon:yes gene_type:complete